MSKTDGYKVGIVGAGMVGEALVRVLEERDFPVSEFRIMATSRRKEKLAGRERQVVPASEDQFDDLDIALFAGSEGAAGASQQYGWQAVEKGVFVVDNGKDYRMDDRVPLVVPEVNGDALEDHQGFVANPNCSTTQMVVALAALRQTAELERVVVSTYQSVSGSGRGGVKALNAQRQKPDQEPTDEELGPYEYPIYDNAIPHVGSLKDEPEGYYSEELKMIQETRKILDMPELPVTATCVRIPVSVSHGETMNVELSEEVSADEAREALADYPGVEVIDDPAQARYPTSRHAAGRDPVYVGRIRKDPSQPRTLDMWCVSDNLRKGAALNTVQIAEEAIKRNLV
ncbi:MAG: aspartate-semialdehyde dehydrogenase [Planctomycetota bacterium]